MYHKTEKKTLIIRVNGIGVIASKINKTAYLMLVVPKFATWINGCILKIQVFI
jgi:hypothetical protein